MTPADRAAEITAALKSLWQSGDDDVREAGIILEYHTRRMIAKNTALQSRLDAAESALATATEALRPFAEQAAWFKSRDQDGRTLASFSGTSYGQLMVADPSHRLRVFHFRDAAKALAAIADARGEAEK